MPLQPWGHSLSDWRGLSEVCWEERKHPIQSPLWVWRVSNDSMPHTPSPISHVVSLFTLDLTGPAEGTSPYGTPGLWLPPSGATYHNLDAENSNSLCLCRMATSVLVLTTLSSNSSLLLLKGWTHLQAKWRGKYQSKGIKTKTPKKKPPKTSLDFTCLLVLSYSTVKSKYVPWKCKPMLTLTCKRAHVSRLHTAQIALFSTLLVLY